MFEKFECVEDVDLKQLSTMKTGGRGKFLIFPKNHLEILEIQKECSAHNLPFYVIGNGSNILFDDAGFDGVLVSLKYFDCIFCEKNFKLKDEKMRKNTLKLRKKMKKIDKNCIFSNFWLKKDVKYKKVWIGAGIKMFPLNILLAKRNLSGLEWSFGIPATLGGMVVGNAGCFCHEIAELVSSVLILKNGKLKVLKKDECKFSYRTSALKDCVVLAVKLQLACLDEKEVRFLMQFYFDMKRKLQPCNMPSLGSVFKKVSPSVSPAKIIDELSLKGHKIGGAEVSTKHAGFIVNTGNATSQDVLLLIKFLENELKKVGVEVEKEIVVLPRK